MTIVKVTRRKRPKRGVRLTWEIPTQNEDGSELTDLVGFRLYAGTSPGAETHSVTLMNPAATSYDWYHEDFDPGETWYYSGKAVRDNGTEIDSDATVERSTTF